MTSSQRHSFARGLLAGLVLGGSCAAIAVRADRDDRFRGVPRLAAAVGLVERHYVDALPPERLLEGAIDGLAVPLDPYSGYFDPEEAEELDELTSGRFVGIGVEIEIDDGWLVLTSVFPDSPAERAGLRPGDRILEIGDVRARDLRMEQAVRLVRGESGTELRLAVRRAGVEDAVVVTAVRGPVHVESVSARSLPDGLGYVRLRAFQDGSAEALHAAIERLHARAPGGRLRGLVLDVRANGGGLLDEAVDIADEFLDGVVVVRIRARLPAHRADLSASGRGSSTELPLALLVDGGSASASEVLAAALQDHARARLFGPRQTFGKGTVQRIVPLPGGGAFKLTVARFHGPSGRVIQSTGIAPDERVGDVEAPSVPAEGEADPVLDAAVAWLGSARR